MINKNKLNELRKKAEEKLSKISSKLDHMPQQSVDKLLHELNVHQIELEMQNEELKASHAKLTESRNMFLKMYEFAPVGYLVVNSNGIIGMSNNKFSEMIGISASQEIRRENLGKFVYYEDINKYYSLFKQFYKKPGQSPFTLRLKLGEGFVYTSITGYKYPGILNSSDEASDFDLLMAFVDITRSVELEEEVNNKNKMLQEMNQTLIERVEEETNQRLKNEQLMLEQKKFADMGEMLSSIAHQWRQPLNTIGLVMQALDDDDILQNREELDNMIDTGVQLVSYLSETIDDFRNFFKPEKNKIAFSFIDSVLHGLKLVKQQLEASNIEFALECICDNKVYASNELELKPECDSKMVTLYGYENEFKQVLLNIIYNAKDAILSNTPKGKGKIKLDIDCNSDDITISVADNGGGIPDEILDDIFKPYFSTKNDLNGTGIGLYMCKTIITEHFNGKISAENINEGARFIIRLPKNNTMHFQN